MSRRLTKCDQKERKEKQVLYHENENLRSIFGQINDVGLIIVILKHSVLPDGVYLKFEPANEGDERRYHEIISSAGSVPKCIGMDEQFDRSSLM